MSKLRRTLALFDVENLLPDGPFQANADDYTTAVHRAVHLANLDPNAHLVMGFGNNATGVFGGRRAWPKASIRCQRGEDGAELALLRHAHDLAAIDRSYGTVVIGSGDHKFTPLIIMLNEIGVRTTVVSWPHKLSRRLRLAAGEVRFITGEQAIEPSANPAA